MEAGSSLPQSQEPSTCLLNLPYTDTINTPFAYLPDFFRMQNKAIKIFFHFNVC
jgi:hypothetical protein